MISAKELKEREVVKNSLKKELYKKLLEQFCRKIETFNSLGQDNCTVTIPEFCFGWPTYDVGSVTMYMHRQLRHLSYRVSIVDRNKIHVAWGKREKKQPRKKEIQQEDVGELTTLAHLKKAADSLRKKFETP
jgi:hypothetical protein